MIIMELARSSSLQVVLMISSQEEDVQVHNLMITQIKCQACKASNFNMRKRNITNSKSTLLFVNDIVIHYLDILYLHTMMKVEGCDPSLPSLGRYPQNPP